MEDLLSNLRKDLASMGIKQKELARGWEISPSGVSDVFKLKREMSCSFLLKSLIRLRYSTDKRIEIFLSYLKKAKPENRREALGIAFHTGKFDLLKIIIDMEKESNNPENKEWADVFELMYKRFSNPTNSKEYLNLILDKKEKVTTVEMKIVLELLTVHTMFQTGNYALITQRFHELEKKIKKTSNKFIKHCIQVRFMEAYCVISLQRGKILETRSICNEIFEIFENEPWFRIIYATALFKMGESYIFEDYEKSKEYLEKTIDFLNKDVIYGMVRKRKMAEYTLSFLKIHHGIELETLDVSEIHPAEVAYLKIKQNKQDEAIGILNNLLYTNNGLSDIQTFYLGLALNDEEIAKKSLQKFEDAGNIFYSILSKKHLGIM